MTSSDLQLSRLSTERPSPVARAGRVLLVLAATGCGLYAAFWTAFVAMVLVTGCFLSCSTPTPTETLGGLALAGLAAGLAAAGPMTAALLHRRRGWWTAAGAVAALALVAQAVVVTGW